ncbi:MAG: PAS domain-containing protein [Minwuia sp.]|uniref:PAS domain-containing protein n=1 Tax=Minwuia sp. TaxID=2493630 RepID=UPI003A888DC3
MSEEAPTHDLGFGPPPADMPRPIRECYAYWDSRRAGRAVPDRRDFDPVIEIPRLLRYIWLLDVVGPPRRYRYRLIGEELTRAGASARVGEHLDETERVGNFDPVQSALDRSVDERVSFWARGTPRLAHDRYVARIETMSMPLTVNGSGDVRMIMNATVYTRLYAG